MQHIKIKPSNHARGMQWIKWQWHDKIGMFVNTRGNVVFASWRADHSDIEPIPVNRIYKPDDPSPNTIFAHIGGNDPDADFSAAMDLVLADFGHVISRHQLFPVMTNRAQLLVAFWTKGCTPNRREPCQNSGINAVCTDVLQPRFKRVFIHRIVKQLTNDFVILCRNVGRHGRKQQPAGRPKQGGVFACCDLAINAVLQDRLRRCSITFFGQFDSKAKYSVIAATNTDCRAKPFNGFAMTAHNAERFAHHQ